jgi:hypothetical protein
MASLLLSLALGLGSFAFDTEQSKAKAREDARALREAEDKNNQLFQQEQLNLKKEASDKEKTEWLVREQNANTDRLNREQIAIQRDMEKRQLDALRTQNAIVDSTAKRNASIASQVNLANARQQNRLADATAMRNESIKREAEQRLAQQMATQRATMPAPAQQIATRRMPQVIRAPVVKRRQGGSKTQDLSYLRSVLGLTAKDARLIYDMYSARG